MCFFVFFFFFPADAFIYHCPKRSLDRGFRFDFQTRFTRGIGTRGIRAAAVYSETSPTWKQKHKCILHQVHRTRGVRLLLLLRVPRHAENSNQKSKFDWTAGAETVQLSFGSVGLSMCAARVI